MFHESEEIYRNLIAQVKDYAIFTTDSRGVINTWNEGCKNVLGYDRDEFIGRHVKMLFPPESLTSGPADEELEIAAERGSAGDDRWMMRKSGERFWASVITTAARDDAGNLTGFIEVMRDLTERERLEERLRESEERLRVERDFSSDIIDTLPGVFYLFNRQGKFLKWNKNLEEITGRSGDEIAMMNPLEFIVEEDRQAVERKIEEVFVSGKADIEARLLTNNGLGIPYFFTGRRIAIDGRPHLIGAGVDITWRKRAEEERERLLAGERDARADAEQANRLKDEFLATISHELRSPLNAMLGWASLLRDPKVRAEQLECALEIIERNTQAQARLIDDLLDVSRIVSGKLSMQMRPVTLNSTAQGAVADLRLAAEAKGIDLRLSEDEELKLTGDSDRLQQVVWNLLSNAIKFTPEGGRIEVVLKRVGESAELRVSDTGRGISPEFLPHVFDRFRQFTRADAHARAGLGLGLTIVRHIVEAHGGSVTAESPGVGLGATFVCKFPMAGAEQETIPAIERQHEQLDTGSAPSLRGIKVLVVDDDEDARDVLKVTLNKYGAEVMTAADAARALDTLASEKVDVLVSDINMPGVDGYELIRRVRARELEQGGRIPAVALTAYARPEDRAHALQAGYHAHVPKPVEPAELEVVVATLARGFNGHDS
jgi:PAS domain S-box-containing protein